MTPLLSITAILLAVVSCIRSVLWLLSLASPALIDQTIAVLGGIGLTLGMYGLSARIALPGTTDTERRNLIATIAGLLLISVYASFDWAESGYQHINRTATADTAITSEIAALLTDTRAISQQQQANADALTAIGHNSKSNRITASASETISTRRQLLDDLKEQHADTQHNTGNSAALLGNARLVLWISLALLLDWTGMTAVRLAAADITARSSTQEHHDPLTAAIRSELTAGTHGNLPAVTRVAEHHQTTPDRIRPIFQHLLTEGVLERNGPRYQLKEHPT